MKKNAFTVEDALMLQKAPREKVVCERKNAYLSGDRERYLFADAILADRAAAVRKAAFCARRHLGGI